MQRIISSLTLLLLIAASAQGQLWKEKVGHSLQAAMATSSPLDVMIVLEEQPQVSTDHLTTKEEKANYTYELLSRTAERSQADLWLLLDQYGADYHTYSVVNSISTRLMPAVIIEIAERADVRKVIHDPWFELDLPTGRSSAIDYRMADTTYGVQMIGAPALWDQGYKGQGITIGGQDTGYAWDVDPLRSKYRGWNGSDSTVTHDYHWHDAVHEISPIHGDSLPTADLNPCGLDSPVPCDDNNHGTHTMGTIVGSTPDEAIGVAPEANWIGCRSLERGWGKLSTYTECFEFFLAPTKVDGSEPDPTLAPHVLNNSWYCPAEEGCTPETWEVMEIVMQNLKASGIFIVVSAGNDGPNCNTIVAPPAIFESAFTVGAVNEEELIANLSSRGPLPADSTTALPHVVAPGIGVRSVIRNGTFRSFSGTSMAGPHTAGMVALLLSADPSLAGQVDLLEDIIMNTTMQKTSTQDCSGISGMSVPNAVYGHGIIHAPDALAALLSVRTIEVPTAQTLLVYPNPTTQSVTFQAAEGERIQRVTIVDMSGRRVHQQIGSHMTHESLDIGQLPAGLYLYTVETETTVHQGKLHKL